MIAPVEYPPDRASVAAMIDHTLLAPEATPTRVVALCEEAVELGVAAVCVSPRWVTVAAEHLAGGSILVATVVGFPSGAHATTVKVTEARLAVEDGAEEIDMVVSLGAVVAGEWRAVADDIASVRAVVTGGCLLKVIVESALLEDETLDRVCRTAVDAGADYVIHRLPPAAVVAVRRMRAAVGRDIEGIGRHSRRPRWR